MSRIGKIPIKIPAGVTVSVSGRNVSVQGKGGSLSIQHRPEVAVKVEGGQVIVTRNQETRQGRAYHGMTRALINNMVIGVSAGFKKELEINGVGWTARAQGKNLVLNIGYAEPRTLSIPAGVTVNVEGNKIIVSGADRQAVGQFAAMIRAQRKPEPYNAKGIKYSDEHIIRKEGKAFAGTTA